MDNSFFFPWECAEHKSIFHFTKHSLYSHAELFNKTESIFNFFMQVHSFYFEFIEVECCRERLKCSQKICWSGRPDKNDDASYEKRVFENVNLMLSVGKLLKKFWKPRFVNKVILVKFYEASVAVAKIFARCVCGFEKEFFYLEIKKNWTELQNSLWNSKKFIS